MTRYLSGAEHAEMMRMRDELRALLLCEAERRGKRRKLNASGEPEWMVCERAAMHGAVNRFRSQRGLSPLGVEDVRRVEDLAGGHVDYVDKFALYCANLAMGVEP